VICACPMTVTGPAGAGMATGKAGLAGALLMSKGH
jgi:hypothetical protein